MIETERQSFIRNHGENLRLMRIKLDEAVLAERIDEAAEMKDIIRFWEEVGRIAEGQEADHG